jgi:hypothetical protein
MAKLLVSADGLSDISFELQPGVLSVGRGADNGLQIAQPSVSTHHAEVAFDPAAGVLTFRDLGSTNGTFLNGNRVESGELRDGQTVYFGTVAVRFYISDTIRARVTIPVATAKPPPLPAAALVASSGKRFCVKHAKNTARYLCKKCGAAFCESCVNTQKFPGKTVRFCPKCGEECVSLAKAAQSKPAIEGNFFRIIPTAFTFPFRGDGGVILAAGALFFGILGAFSGFLFFVSIVAGGYMAAYMQSVVAVSAQGDDTPPRYPDFSDFYSEILSPLLRIAGCALVCFGPAGLYQSLVEPANEWVFYGLLLAGALYFPMSLLAVSLFETLAALNPMLVVVSIAKAPLEYLAACVVLVGSFAGEAYLEKIIVVPYIGNIVGQFISLYFIMVEMRILGLLYRCKQKQLGWFPNYLETTP